MGDFRKQGSAEWLEWRKTRVTASDVPVILDLSPYKTRLRLWEEKLGLREPPPSNPAMLRGQAMEADLRDAYCTEAGEVFMPEVVQHPTIPWIGASLDGRSFDGKRLLEIKVCNASVMSVARRGEVAEHHYPQIQVQLMCCPEATHCVYLCSHGGSTATVVVERDLEYIQRILPDLKAFHDSLRTGDAPGYSASDSVPIEDEAFFALEDELLRVDADYDALKARRQALRDQMIEYTDDGKCHGRLYEITRVNGTRCNYRQACVDAELDLDGYRTESIGSYRFNLRKQDV